MLQLLVVKSKQILISELHNFFLSADDTDLVLDLRTLNGKPGSSLAAQPLVKNEGSGDTAILKLFCRNALTNCVGSGNTLKVN